jgi:hypothetical protein
MVAHSGVDGQIAAWTRMYEAGTLPKDAYLAMVTAWATAQARASFEHAATAAAAPAPMVAQATQVSPDGNALSELGASAEDLLPDEVDESSAEEKQDDEWLPRCRGGSRTTRTPSRTTAKRGQTGQSGGPLST